MTQTTVRIAASPSPDNDDRPAATEPGFHRAFVSDRAWSSLLRLRQGQKAGLGAGWSEEERAAWSLYQPLAEIGPETMVFAQIGQSLDGRIATESGDAANISGRDGLKHLHRCRALADAVVVGVNTVLADNPQLTVRLVDGASPTRVVIDPRGRLPDDSGIFAGGGRKLVVQACDRTRPQGIETILVDAGRDGLDPGAIVSALAARGLRRILIEGGANTIGRFLDAGALDRLHVGISPLLIGAGPAGLNASPVPRLSDALRPRTSVYGLGTDIIFDCALERRRPAA
jgi:riboflavin-specific deaminase-like protein